MVICRLILDIFGEVQNFQISRFQKIWKLSGNCCIWQIARYWVFLPLSFGHWVWFFTRKFWIFIYLEFPDSRFSGIWKFQVNQNPKIWSEKLNSVTKTEWKKYPISCNLSNAAISREFPDFLESGIWKSGNSGSHQKCPKLAYKWSWFLFF